MYTVLVVLHVLVSLALILIVLLQTGKGASMGAAFGGSSQTLFGSRGPGSFLGKLTTAAAIIFMFTSLGLTLFYSRGTSSSIMGRSGVQPKSSPAPVQTSPAPAAPAPQGLPLPPSPPKPPVPAGQ